VVSGSNPLEEKQRAGKGENVTQLTTIYIEQYAKLHKKSWRADKRRIEQYIIPHIGNRLIDSVERADVAKLHLKITKSGKPYEANRVFSLLV